MNRQPKFRKGQSIEAKVGDGWLSGLVTFVWRAVETDTGKRVFRYDLAGTTVEGLAWNVLRVPEETLRRPDPRRGKRRVLRSHSVKTGRLT
jgi:hypothetical protein